MELSVFDLPDKIIPFTKRENQLTKRKKTALTKANMFSADSSSIKGTCDTYGQCMSSTLI